MTTKHLIAAVAAVIIGLAIWGAYDYPVQQTNVGSTTGSTFNTAKIGATVWTMATAGTASSTQTLLNGDSSDRIIQDVFYSCSGVGSLTQPYATWNIQAATSSSATGIGSNTNYLLNTTVATSSALLYVASTTPGVTVSPYVRVWGAGTYLNFQSNGTGPASCIIGVHYLAS